MKLAAYLTSVLLLVSSVYSLPKLDLQNILNNVNVNDLIDEVDNLGLKIDQNQINNLLNNNVQNLLQGDKNLLAELLNVDQLLPMINNLTNLNLNQESLLPVLNSLLNQNATDLSEILAVFLDNPQIQNIINNPSVQQSILSILNNPESVSNQDLLNILFGVINSTEMEESVRKHLLVYIPELASKLIKANNSNEVLSILEPIITFHLNYYLKQFNISLEIDSFLNNLPINPALVELIQKYFYTNTIDLKDVFNLLQQLSNKYISDKNLADHLFVYLPDLLLRLSNAKTQDDFYQIFEYLLTSHFGNLEANLTDLILNNELFNSIAQIQSVQSLLSKLTTSGVEDINLSDLVNIYLEYMNMPALTESQLNHLNIYIPDLINKIQSANSSDLMSILEPIISFHLNYYLNVNTKPLEQLINSLINEIPFVGQLLEFVNRLNQQGSGMNLTDWQQQHLFVYLPEFISNLTKVKSFDEFVDLIKPIAMQHLSLLTNNEDAMTNLITDLLGSSAQNSSLFDLNSVQTLLMKLSTGEITDLKLSDLVNIYLEYMDMPALTESQLNHLNIYIPDLINKLQSANSSDLMSILEPIISFHLNYYLNVNTKPLEQLIISLINSNPGLFNLFNSLSNLQSTLNLSQSEYNHLFVYIPEFLYNLTMAKDNAEIISMLQNVLALHLNTQSGSVLNLLDQLLSDFTMSTLNTTIEPIFNRAEFVMLFSDLVNTYFQGGSFNQSKIIEEALMFMAPAMINPMKMVIYQLSPEIYEYAKDQTDSKVMIAYAVHAGESVLHDNLRALGIPYDSVYLGATTTPLMTTTTPRRIIDLDLINQIINLNKDKNDINNFLGNTGNNKPLKPFEPDTDGGGNDGGFDYF